VLISSITKASAYFGNQEIGLQQRFSVVKNPETGRYTLIKGGNTRLLAFKALYRETSDTKFAAIDCIVEAFNINLLGANIINY
jgi:hypothetical protein